jgi:hypothetical protein
VSLSEQENACLASVRPWVQSTAERERKGEIRKENESLFELKWVGNVLRQVEWLVPFLSPGAGAGQGATECFDHTSHL